MEDIKQRGIPVSANFSLEGLLTTDATVQSTCSTVILFYFI